MKTRLLSPLTFIFAAAVLAGCASPRPPVQNAPVAPPPGKPGVAAPAAVTLPAEQKRLAELFRGTPVVVELTGDNALRVEVPLKYSFDKGKSAVRPPLAKVLDHLVPSAKSPGARTRVTAPGDSGAGTLARDRAAAARDYMVGKGAPATSFNVAGSSDDAVEVVVTATH
jgi:outer membrane protein OmpA-like peptidoglycan-associated protein